MTETPPDAPLSVRLGARFGPEVVASILVVVLLVVVASIAVSGRRGTIVVEPSPAPSVGVVPSVAAVPSATALPTGTAVPPSPSPSQSPSPALPRSQARGLLVAVDRLLRQRADLVTELAKAGDDTAAIVDLIEKINTSLLIQDGALTQLQAIPVSADLATRIRAVNEAALDAVRRTQQASIRNAKAYRTGAAEVVDDLAPLLPLRDELAALAGEPASPTPTVAPTQATGTADPSGATP
jgi:hypothetical protein